MAIRILLHNINKFPKLTRQLQNALRFSRILKISGLSRRTVQVSDGRRLYTREDHREDAPHFNRKPMNHLENFLLCCIGHFFFNFTISLHNLNNGMLNLERYVDVCSAWRRIDEDHLTIIRPSLHRFGPFT